MLNVLHNFIQVVLACHAIMAKFPDGVGQLKWKEALDKNSPQRSSIIRCLLHVRSCKHATEATKTKAGELIQSLGLTKSTRSPNDSCEFCKHEADEAEREQAPRGTLKRGRDNDHYEEGHDYQTERSKAKKPRSGIRAQNSPRLAFSGSIW